MEGYWVRICKTCETVDLEGLPFTGGDAPGTANSITIGETGRDRLPAWRCKACGGGDFRVDNWTEGAPRRAE
jgi:hypothetical protein